MRKPTVVPSAIFEAPRVTTSSASSVRGKGPANDKPLQLRLPRAEVEAIKLAAAEREETISDFMLACLH
jgi:hypothetical protein